MIDKENKKLFNEKSLKKRVVYFLVSFIILFAIVVAVLSSFTLYTMKIESISNNQKQMLKQIKLSLDVYIDKIKSTELDIKNSTNIEYKLQDVLSYEIIDSIFIFTKEKKLKKSFSNYNFDDKKLEEKIHIPNMENKTFWSNVFYSKTINKMTISYSFEYKNEIIVFYLNLKTLQNYTKNILTNDNSPMVFLINKQGQDINSLIIKKDISSKTQVSDMFVELINKKDEYKLIEFNNKILGTVDNGMYTKIKNDEWYLIVRENTSSIENYITKILIIILVIIVFFSLLAVFLSSKLLSTIFLSLEKFESQTESIARGNYKEKISPERFLEFEKLSTSFEKMRFEINKRENHLKQSLNNFRILIDSTMEAVVIHDTKVIIDINYSALKIIGLKDKTELIGRPIKDFISDNYKSYMDDHLEKNKISTKPYEYEIINKKGTLRNVIGQDSLIEHEGIERRISVFLDITDMKSKDKLIFQQTKMASIGEMLSNIAHHWRQPLNTIRTLASATKLEEELGVLDKTEFLNRLELIADNTVYLSKVLDDLSDYSMSRKNLKRFNISNVIENSINFLKSNLTINNVKIIDNLDNSLSLFGNVNDFTQIIMSILNNSQDAFLLNDIKNRYVLISLHQDDNKIFLSIKDTARGIQKEEITKIFDPYFTTKHKSKGTGVGLFLTHQIITEQFKGQIVAQNSYSYIQNKKYRGLEISMEFNVFKK